MGLRGKHHPTMQPATSANPLEVGRLGLEEEGLGSRISQLGPT